MHRTRSLLLVLSTLLAVGGSLGARGAGADVVVQPAEVRYTNFPAPAPLAQDAGEPSIGNDPKTGATIFQASTQTSRVTFDDTGAQTTATWQDVTFPATNLTTLDPILFTDRVAGRTLVSQLAGVCSTTAVTTDDGASWLPSQGCSLPGGADHQTIGGGKAHTAIPATDGRILYYCSQSTVTATCGTSVDGGLTFGPAVPIYTLDASPVTTGCAGLHGHVKVSEVDGTAYVPNFECGTSDVTTQRQSVVVSEDDGLTWNIRKIPDSTPNDVRSDPAVGLDATGKAYYAYEDKSGALKVATSANKGVSWTPSVDAGAPLGVRYSVFPAVVGGGPGRAAVAFLGATKPSDDPVNTYEKADYDGEWHLYVTTTVNGGATWKTSDLTPNDPVQRGCVYWGSPCDSAQRNLLDFMDVTYDKDGRVLVGYADGCVTDCIAGTVNSRTDRGAIARQTCGQGIADSAGDAAIAATCDPPPTGAGVACPADALARDGTGDAGTIDAVLTSTQGPAALNDPGLDIRDFSYSDDGGAVTVRLHVDDLTDTPPTGGVGRYYRSYFTYGGVEYQLIADLDRTPGAPSDAYSLSIPGTVQSTSVALTGTADTATDVITVKLPLSTFNASASPTVPLANGGVLSSLSVTSQRNTGAVLLVADTAAGTCAYTLGAGASPSPTVPEVPLAYALPASAAVLVGGGFALRRRRAARATV